MPDKLARGVRTTLRMPEIAFGLLALAVAGVVTTVIRESTAED